MRKLPLMVVLATALIALSPIAAMADEVGVDVGVDKYITATFNYDAVDFGNLAAGSTNTSALGQDELIYSWGSGIFNVSVDTNFEYKVSALGTDFTGATSNFPIGNLLMDAEAGCAALDPTCVELAYATALSEDSQVIDDTTGTAGVDTNYNGFWLSIPAAQYAEAYASTVTITYANL
jgi:hypothetical protein